jgi:pyruvate/2-oxoacid:ferredoxin oxidoreductase beta subunit
MNRSRFIHILATCPPGWRIASDLSVKVARMAVQTKIFPLYEVENGVKYTINVRPKGLPVSLYLKMQDRFKHLTAEDMAIIQENVDREWKRLEDRVASS